jgi:hypothetical protein
MNFPPLKKIVTPKKIDMTTINAEIEILKIKIAYRRKLAILQNLRSEDAGDKSEFYVFIGGETLFVSRKRAQSFSADISLFQRLKTNPPPIYSEINLKNYHNHIKKYSLYFKNYTRAFLTEAEKITHIIIFTKDTPRSR